MSASDIALVVSLKAFSSSLRFKQAALGLRLRSVKQNNVFTIIIIIEIMIIIIVVHIYVTKEEKKVIC